MACFTFHMWLTKEKITNWGEKASLQQDINELTSIHFLNTKLQNKPIQGFHDVRTPYAKPMLVSFYTFSIRKRKPTWWILEMLARECCPVKTLYMTKTFQLLCSSSAFNILVVCFPGQLKHALHMLKWSCLQTTKNQKSLVTFFSMFILSNPTLRHSW